jgi:hypothetical protein
MARRLKGAVSVDRLKMMSSGMMLSVEKTPTAAHGLALVL